MNTYIVLIGGVQVGTVQSISEYDALLVASKKYYKWHPNLISIKIQD